MNAELCINRGVAGARAILVMIRLIQEKHAAFLFNKMDLDMGVAMHVSWICNPGTAKDITRILLNQKFFVLPRISCYSIDSQGFSYITTKCTIIYHIIRSQRTVSSGDVCRKGGCHCLKISNEIMGGWITCANHNFEMKSRQSFISTNLKLIQFIF